MISHQFSIWGTLIFSSIAFYDDKFFISQLVVNKDDIETKLPSIAITTHLKECYFYYSTFKTGQNFKTHVNDLLRCVIPIPGFSLISYS